MFLLNSEPPHVSVYPVSLPAVHSIIFPHKLPEGELYVSFWNSGDEFFLTTEEGLKGEEQEPAVQKGGIVFGAL